MKKTAVMVLTALVSLAISQAGYAKTGDVAGNIYSTDIKACINGVWVDSYNIGGNTVVVVEDITNQYRYYDALRTLIIDDFAPERLVASENNTNQKTGKIVGKIYETDIKTYFRGKELNSFSLDGKTAVIIEELGMDNAFSETGGRYIWNDKLRTITLESACRYPYSMRNMMEDEGYNIILGESDYTYRLEAKPVSAPLTGGYILCEKEITDRRMIPVEYEGEIIGYRCRFPDMWVETDENGTIQSREVETLVEYFYTDKVEDMIFRAGKVTPTVEDWLAYFERHTMSEIKDSFETEEYMFLYMSTHIIHGNAERLIKINKADGSKLEYSDQFESVSLHGQKKFDKVEIDRENETVLIHYDKDYLINLRTDEIREYQRIETDIGSASSDGQPSQYECQFASGGQTRYKLISGDAAMEVEGFSVNEYFYANMLPLAETFDFLNIKYSFENDILTIDTSEAKPFSFEIADEKPDFISDDDFCYLYVDKVLLNGEETEITYRYISGHFENMHTGRTKAKPYVYNGKVYINDSFIRDLYGN